MDLTKKRKADENGVSYPSTTTNESTFTHVLSPEDIDKILETFTKDQCVSILRNASLGYPDILESIRQVADGDISHRKLFIRGLGWETTTDKLKQVFSVYGELDEAIVITDKGSGKSKGYGFVTFKHVDGAILSLKEPNKKIDGRITVTQLAAAGNSSSGKGSLQSGGGGGGVDVAVRKIYVGNVPFEISSEKLLNHFSMYGEIEEGPLGFDKQTGKAKGFAFFVYKTEEGAKAALVDPVKTVEGHQVLCKLATDNKKGKQQQQQPQQNMMGPGGMPNTDDRMMPGSNYGGGVPVSGLGPYTGYSGPGIMQQQPPPQPQPGMVNPHAIGGPGYGNQGPPASFTGGYAGGYAGGAGGDYSGNAGGYRMPQSSAAGMPPSSGGGYPDGGSYGYPSQVPQQPGAAGSRVPPGAGMYQGMPPYY
ncbi:UBP1-associated protein 2C-like [Lycium barbarum]|uniref:UBP1-associated protein 2C-like n=1 Tax=Lycium barbarum TaxID=112863 RepID=UPI00293E4B92|nr:UBP1-associated protein 2C-like [Lycium barbarum]XP_060209759.1 UBP1-associated protein 2C-like [Lycium barbarum]XP_060209760.1 UBP1-associated protein 2C-like [Lycium barbarum]